MLRRWRLRLAELCRNLAMMPKRVYILMVTPAILLVIGTLGYEWLEDPYTLFDSFYMTVITLTTIGYQEVYPLSDEGRMFTVFLALGGIFTLFWAAGEMIGSIVGGEIQRALGRQRMEKSLATLSNHFIVCGYGRMGQMVCQEFSVQKLPFVIIDQTEQLMEDFHLPHGIPLVGDATSDDVLRKAGVERARALVTVTRSDAENLFITMSARLLNDNLTIVARAEDEHAQEKLHRAGANRVVTPYLLGGLSLAQAVLRPTVVEFIDLATRSEHAELQIEEVTLAEQSELSNKPIADSLLHKKHGIFIVAIKKKSKQMVYNPPGNAVMEAGDTLIVLGHRERLDQLVGIARGE